MKTATEILFDFQRDLILRCRQAIKDGHRRILLVLPTGGGKSILSCAMIESALKKQSSALFLVHRRELIKQQSKHFTDFGLDHGFIAANMGYDFDHNLIIAGVQSLAPVIDKLPPPRILFIDEAHHSPSAQHSAIINQCDNSIIIGLTATPERLDGKGMDDQFDIMIEGPTVAELIKWGFLCPYDYYVPEFPVGISEDDIEKVTGDFPKSFSERILNQAKITGDVIENYKKHCMGKKGFIFASNVKHSKDMAKAFNQAGISAAHIDGTMSQDKRDKIDKAFRSGIIKILCNVNLATEGYDVKDSAYLGILRLTKSISLLKQIWGRVMRVSDGKDRAFIFDHANNAVRGMGLPDSPIKWSLEGKSGRSRNNDSESFSITQCLSCGKYFPSGTKICPSCGATIKTVPRKELQTKEQVKMKKVEEAEFKRMVFMQRKAEERNCWNYGEFIALAQSRRYPQAVKWAHKMMAVHKKRIRSKSNEDAITEEIIT